jgi:hypothetical protein
MSLHNLMQWMADTEWSVGLHESRYAYSIIESIHVWTLCVFVGFAVLLDRSPRSRRACFRGPRWPS